MTSYYQKTKNPPPVPPKYKKLTYVDSGGTKHHQQSRQFDDKYRAVVVGDGEGNLRSFLHDNNDAITTKELPTTGSAAAAADGGGKVHVVKIKVNSVAANQFSESSINETSHHHHHHHSTVRIGSAIDDRDDYNSTTTAVGFHNNNNSNNLYDDTSSSTNVIAKYSIGHQEGHHRYSNNGDDIIVDENCCLYDAASLPSGQCSPSDNLDSGTCSDIDGNTPPPPVSLLLNKKKSSSSSSASSCSKMVVAATAVVAHRRCASLNSSGIGGDEDSEAEEDSCDSITSSEYDQNNLPPVISSAILKCSTLPPSSDSSAVAATTTSCRDGRKFADRFIKRKEEDVLRGKLCRITLKDYRQFNNNNNNDDDTTEEIVNDEQAVDGSRRILEADGIASITGNRVSSIVSIINNQSNHYSNNSNKIINNIDDTDQKKKNQQQHKQSVVIDENLAPIEQNVDINKITDNNENRTARIVIDNRHIDIVDGNKSRGIDRNTTIDSSSSSSSSSSISNDARAVASVIVSSTIDDKPDGRKEKSNERPQRSEVKSNDKYLTFHMNENNFKIAATANDVKKPDDDDGFAGCKDFDEHRENGLPATIRSSRGTIRGVKNRVRAGIATFLQIPTTKSWQEKEVGKIVVYTSTMGIVRETSQRCLKVRQILRTHMVKFEEKDVFMSREIQTEIRERMNMDDISVPQVFVEGIHVGDAEIIEKLNETGELRRMLKPYKSPDACNTCKVCGGYRLLPCNICNGSKKSVHRNNFTTGLVALKCMNCDEVGLVKCNAC